MTPEREAKISELRDMLKALTPEERRATIASRGMIATIEGRTLSLHNTLLVYLQCNGSTPTIVGGFQQWRKAGRIVKRGEHGLTIWFPVGPKSENGELLEANRYFTGTVFDILQTEPLDGKSTSNSVRPEPVKAPVKTQDAIMTGWKVV